MREKNPAYKSGDGVHPSAKGHAAIARAMLEGLGVTAGEQNLGIGMQNLPSPTNAESREIYRLVLQRHRLLSTSYLEHVGHKRPGRKGKIVPLKEALTTARDLEDQIRRLAGKLKK